ncbi:tyrosine-type recombinase/integrase [Paraburkholderia kirstenboschensis]|uniref:Tyrosine-type recombinase/integrase n=1 Tax=Paraburkholderia kirstenboschensis TaxID=1245436 RepID=A0ABZ0ELI7_9BURK|nr:tyrosine-type recombinase/integrase [Paraburkholderia kirstenboschensis]WOD18026.1 tyrosine-type recombinase/integrase [Paraburkholderia kirstenboschensis]
MGEDQLGVRSWRLLEDSVLAASRQAYVGYLQSHGYALHTIGHYLASVAHFSRWLTRKRIRLDQIDENLVRQFIFVHLPNCDCLGRRKCALNFTRAALKHLLKVLRADGCIRPPPLRLPGTIVDELNHLDVYLDEIRGLAASTRRNHHDCACDFLVDQFGGHRIDMGRIRPADVLHFVVERSKDHTPASAGTIASSLRVYLRFRQFSGDHIEGLIAAVPKVAVWSMARLPKLLTQAQLAQFLSAFDTQTASGRRDYAMARLLVDLGLRVGEVAALQLADVDWHEGTLRIRATKCKRTDLLPLPVQTGRALFDYVRFGRPQTSSRALFVRHRAPFDRPVTPAVLCSAIRLAYARCGWPSSSMGAHLLRHTAASRMLGNGASLKDIADVLRHRSINTTMIYAKVDFRRLAAVVSPWPGSRS